MDGTTAETLGQRVIGLQQAAGLSVEALADHAAVPVWSLQNWMYDYRVPGLGTGSRLAEALGVPLQLSADCVEGAGTGVTYRGRGGVGAVRAGRSRDEREGRNRQPSRLP